MNKKRLPYIDYIKAIGIILVIIGHINFANADCKTWIYSFHMPLFFFASGLVVNVKKKKDKDIELHFLYSKIGNLLYPYFVWAIIYAPFIQLTNLENWVRYGSFFSTNRNEFQHIHQYNYIHQNDYIHYVIKKSN